MLTKKINDLFKEAVSRDQCDREADQIDLLCLIKV
jgi:hypothetical protein